MMNIEGMLMNMVNKKYIRKILFGQTDLDELKTDVRFIRAQIKKIISETTLLPESDHIIQRVERLDWLITNIAVEYELIE